MTSDADRCSHNKLGELQFQNIHELTELSQITLGHTA